LMMIIMSKTPLYNESKGRDGFLLSQASPTQVNWSYIVRKLTKY
jgi:hypothetical protein